MGDIGQRFEDLDVPAGRSPSPLAGCAPFRSQDGLRRCSAVMGEFHSRPRVKLWTGEIPRLVAVIESRCVDNELVKL